MEENSDWEQVASVSDTNPGLCSSSLANKVDSQKVSPLDMRIEGHAQWLLGHLLISPDDYSANQYDFYFQPSPLFLFLAGVFFWSLGFGHLLEPSSFSLRIRTKSAPDAACRGN